MDFFEAYQEACLRVQPRPGYDERAIRAAKRQAREVGNRSSAIGDPMLGETSRRIRQFGLATCCAIVVLVMIGLFLSDAHRQDALLLSNAHANKLDFVSDGIEVADLDSLVVLPGEQEVVVGLYADFACSGARGTPYRITVDNDNVSLAKIGENEPASDSLGFQSGEYGGVLLQVSIPAYDEFCELASERSGLQRASEEQKGAYARLVFACVEELEETTVAVSAVGQEAITFSLRAQGVDAWEDVMERLESGEPVVIAFGRMGGQ